MNLLLAGTLLNYSAKAEDAQSVFGIRPINAFFLDHAVEDMQKGVPIDRIMMHIEQYHGGIDCIETKRIGWEMPFAKKYVANDGTVFFHIGTSKEDFTPQLNSKGYRIIHLPNKKW